MVPAQRKINSLYLYMISNFKIVGEIVWSMEKKVNLERTLLLPAVRFEPVSFWSKTTLLIMLHHTRPLEH